MKIQSVHIYHFGVLQDCKLDIVPSGLQLLFGENEAGKTTLMDFMKCMLFGFPFRTQTKRRYEPKNGNRLGGKMTIEHPILGKWTIERIEGSKASGDVSIFNESGEQKEESFLTLLLEGVDQTLFEGAYCFNLDGLQKLDKLTSEELGNFLLSTAISGDRDLLEIEQTFEKKQSELFKKAGKKPVINEKMEQLKGIEKSLHDLRNKNESYQMLKEQKEMLEKKIEQSAEHLKEIQKELTSVKRLFELKPILEKYKQLKRQLDSYDQNEMAFPENGIHRYEQWNKEIALLDAELSYINERLLSIEKEQKHLNIDEQLLRNQKVIKQLFNKLPEYEHDKRQLLDCERNLTNIQTEELGLFEAIGETWRPDELRKMTLTLSSLNEHEQLLKQMVNLQEKKRRLEDDLEESRLKLEELEKDEADLKQLLLPEEEYMRYERDKNRTQQRTVFPKYAALLPVISAALLIYTGWTSQQMFVLSCGALLLIAALGITLFFSKKDGSIPSAKNSHERRYVEDEVNRKQWIQLTAAIAHENKLYLQLAKQLDYLEVEEARVSDETEKWAVENEYPGKLEKLLLSGYVDNLYKLKDLMKQRDYISNKSDTAYTALSRYEEEISTLMTIFQNDLAEDMKEAVEELNSKLQEQVKKVSEREHLEKSHLELNERKDALLSQRGHIQHETENLWKEAHATSEAGYYQKANIVSDWMETTKEWEMTHNQLLSLGISDNGIESMAEQITDDYEESLRLMKSYEMQEEEGIAEHKADTEDRAKLDWEMKKLVEDGSYSEHLHRYEMLKEEWNQLVRKWAGYRLAQHALQVVKEHYQKTKMPAVLETSSLYFSKITEGEYKSIIYTSTNEMLLIRADGTRFNPSELSRGTAEQVYLAIRLAVAMNAGPTGFPVMMDDIAVNFDEKRTKRTLSLIDEIAQDRQILFFTCHAHLRSIVPSVPLIHWPSHSMLAEK